MNVPSIRDVECRRFLPAHFCAAASNLLIPSWFVARLL